MTPSGALTCAAVWELTAYTNGYVANTNHFSGELHRPILQLGISYGLSSLTELPPPIQYCLYVLYVLYLQYCTV